MASARNPSYLTKEPLGSTLDDKELYRKSEYKKHPSL